MFYSGRGREVLYSQVNFNEYDEQEFHILIAILLAHLVWNPGKVNLKSFLNDTETAWFDLGEAVSQLHYAD